MSFSPHPVQTSNPKPLANVWPWCRPLLVPHQQEGQCWWHNRLALPYSDSEMTKDSKLSIHSTLNREIIFYEFASKFRLYTLSFG